MKLILRDKEKELECQQERIQELQEHKDQLEQQLQGLHRKVGETSLLLTQREQKIVVLQRHLQEAREQGELKEQALQGRLDEAQRALAQGARELEALQHQQQQQAQGQEESVKEQAGSLQQALEQAHATPQECQAELEDHKEHAQRLQEELAVERQRVQALEEVLGDLRAESREQEKALLALQQQCAAQAQEREAEARTLRDSWLQAEVMLQERDRELEALRADGQSSQCREEAARVQAEALQKALSKAQATLQEKEQHLLGQAELSRSLEASTATLQAALDSCQAQSRQLEEALRKREGEIEDQDLRHQEAVRQLQEALAQRDEELRHQRRQGQLLEKPLAQRGLEDVTQEKQEPRHEREEEETRGLRESLRQLRWTLAQKEEEILELREARPRKDLEDSPPSHRASPGEELSSTLDSSAPTLQRELERLQVALRQTEAREIEWREKAQDLALSLAQSKASVSSLQEVALFLQASVRERDSEQQRLQVSHPVGGKGWGRARSAWALGLPAPQGVRRLRSRAPQQSGIQVTVLVRWGKMWHPQSLPS